MRCRQQQQRLASAVAGPPAQRRNEPRALPTVGAIVVPAKMGNHLIGHAIDCNLVDGKLFWNSIKMREGLTGNAKKFIDLVRAGKILRWGGDFHDKDEVHFDDGLNLSDAKKWHEIHDYLVKNKL